ncbi:hypothetical protein V1478_018179 [Vespula squamosa]|uniref:Uncharacterized protein n=1 Tax=Vespula squamosa TaxID=30214 RepID=A0ABD1ZU88_VESSQ
MISRIEFSSVRIRNKCQHRTVSTFLLMKYTFMDSDKIFMVDAGRLMINIKTIIITFIKKLVLQYNSISRNRKQNKNLFYDG